MKAKLILSISHLFLISLPLLASNEVHITGSGQQSAMVNSYDFDGRKYVEITPDDMLTRLQSSFLIEADEDDIGETFRNISKIIFRPEFGLVGAMKEAKRHVLSLDLIEKLILQSQIRVAVRCLNNKRLAFQGLYPQDKTQKGHILESIECLQDKMTLTEDLNHTAAWCENLLDLSIYIGSTVSILDLLNQFLDNEE